MDHRPYTQLIDISIAGGATTGTTSDPWNPINSHYLRKVIAHAANDADVNSFKIEMLRTDPADPATPTYITMYTSSDEAIADDDAWHDCDSDNVEVPIHFPSDGNITWRATVDVPAAAAMTVYIRRTLQK